MPTTKNKEISKMEAYGYNVKGDEEVLCDIAELKKNNNFQINWSNFNTGDTYWTDNSEAYRVKIDHASKEVMLEKML